MYFLVLDLLKSLKDLNYVKKRLAQDQENIKGRMWGWKERERKKARDGSVFRAGDLSMYL